MKTNEATPPPDESLDRPGLKSPRLAIRIFLCILVIFVAVLLLQIYSDLQQYFLQLLFVFAVLCLDVVYLIHLFCRRLPSLIRIPVTSFVFALLFAPSIIIGHGVGIVPAWLLLFGQEAAHYDIEIAFRRGVVPIAIVFLIAVAIQIPFHFMFRKESSET